mmetsp:Transcript_9855/g.29842  ORF Transcript_9855/g.29842 Transcript_9855/m.29842 type:complete len:352 (+) Transcript_9855:65-1120(+)
MVESLVSSFRAQLRLNASPPVPAKKDGPIGLMPPPPHHNAKQKKFVKHHQRPSVSDRPAEDAPSLRRSLTEGRAIAHGHGVYELPRTFSMAQVLELKRQVDEKYELRGWTDRGASLSTHDVFVRDLTCKDVVYRAIDACCHAVEKITGNLVTYNRHEVFVIVYDAAQQPGLEKHRDGTSKAQRNTVLVALDDAVSDYVGGGTRFFPDKPDTSSAASSSSSSSSSSRGTGATPASSGASATSSSSSSSSSGSGSSGTFGALMASAASSSRKVPEPFTVQPEQGGSVIFPPDLMHEGIPISRGRRHVIAVFTKDGSTVSFNDKQKLRKEQYEAALAFELQAIRDDAEASYQHR